MAGKKKGRKPGARPTSPRRSPEEAPPEGPEANRPEPRGPDLGPLTPYVPFVVLGLVLIQALIPLTYYVGNDDPYDERFSWRMFSAIRVVQCRTEVREETAGASSPLNLPQTIHEAWISHLRRNRRSVIEAFLERRCDLTEADAVVVENYCVDANRVRLPTLEWRRSCADGDLSEPDFAVLEATGAGP
ncbi:MAG: hypothetical protein AAGF12_18705 [Myxococcota bacterium]